MSLRERVDVIVIGGGPAGATAAARCAREGLRTCLLEAAHHPRPHVGESLLPGIIPILADIDALDAVSQAGFGRKTGSTLWHWGRTPRWDLWFADSDAYDAAWLVERARFDAILFDAARRAGAELRTHARVRAVLREGTRVVGVQWQRAGDETLHELEAPLVIDASGQSSLLARELGTRERIAGLEHQAMWAHFEHADRLPPPRAEQALFVAQPQQWWWMFPLSPTLTSVGVVQLDTHADGAPMRTAPRPEFDAELAGCDELVAVLGPRARRITKVHHERDWSYRMRETSGPGWIAVGDAAGFIDPVLSTGVMLAMHSGWHAARTAAAIHRGDDETTALAAYSRHHRGMFDDLLRMVRFYYQQNLDRDDYFWESKRILLQETTALRPQKAFVVLTSGLVQNLALADRKDEAVRRVERDDAPPLETPASLGFVCLHLRAREADEIIEGPDPFDAVYVLVEPADPAAPTLFRSRNFHINAIAPRHGNDPISQPRFAAPLRAIGAWVAELDDVEGESLADFWRRRRAALLARLHSLPGALALARVFGE
jgi:flavin-dependent dehydrogenase